MHHLSYYSFWDKGHGDLMPYSLVLKTMPSSLFRIPNFIMATKWRVVLIGGLNPIPDCEELIAMHHVFKISPQCICPIFMKKLNSWNLKHRRISNLMENLRSCSFITFTQYLLRFISYKINDVVISFMDGCYNKVCFTIFP